MSILDELKSVNTGIPWELIHWTLRYVNTKKQRDRDLKIGTEMPSKAAEITLCFSLKIYICLYKDFTVPITQCKSVQDLNNTICKPCVQFGIFISFPKLINVRGIFLRKIFSYLFDSR